MYLNYKKYGSVVSRQIWRNASALLLSGMILSAQAAPKSPAGTWDCSLSGGGQQGIAFLTFSDDGTFSGYRLLVGSQKTLSEIEVGRNTGGDSTRNGFSSVTPTSPSSFTN